VYASIFQFYNLEKLGLKFSGEWSGKLGPLERKKGAWQIDNLPKSMSTLRELERKG
jgi:hypothetical protein